MIVFLRFDSILHHLQWLTLVINTEVFSKTKIMQREVLHEREFKFNKKINLAACHSMCSKRRNYSRTSYKFRAVAYSTNSSVRLSRMSYTVHAAIKLTQCVRRKQLK